MVRIQLEDRGYLDVKEGTYFPLNFALGDIRDISKRKGTFSKTITLVGNDNNHNLLNHYYDVNIESGEFDINQLTKCSVIQDGVVILEDAYLQLVEVTKSENDIRHDQNVEYKVLVKDSVSDFFTILGNKELTDINLSEYDHTYQASNVTGSFSNDVTDGYKYLLPFIPTNNYNLTSCHPAIYAKQYFDRIFQGAGYTYEWGTLTPSSGTGSDGNYFEKLLIPYNGGEPKIDKDDSRVEANNSSKTVTYNKLNGIAPVSYINVLTGWTETQDNDNLFTPASGLYEPIANIVSPENITFSFTVTYNVVVTNNEAGNVVAPNIPLHPTLYITDSNATLPSGSVAFSDIVNSTIIETHSISGTYATGSTTEIASTTAAVTIPITNVTTSSDLYLSAGFTNPSIVAWFYDTNNNPADVDVKLNITSISVKAEVSATYGYQDTLSINQYIPKKVKQSDFIKSIFMMYNLYAEVDKSNPNKLILQTRDDYYDAGAEVDWTDKLSKDRDQNIKFLPELASKKMLLTYKPDTDDPNKVYTQATNDTYGQLRFTFENEYTRGEDKKELIFSPTPHTSSSFGAIVPMLGYLPECNIRILIDGGTNTCNEFNIYNYYDGSSWVGSTDLTTYPVITHFDDPVNPSFDINFATCDFYFYNELNSRTNNNLYNNYWRRTLGQIDKGKMLTAYFALTESDIQKLNLNDKIRINNSWWNINKVIDYNANARGFTKVELISVDEESKLTPFAQTNDTTTITNISFNGTIPTKPTTPIKPTKPNVKPALTAITDSYNSNSNTALPWQDVKFIGRGNTVAGDVKGAVIIGDDKHVSQDGVYAPVLGGSLEIQLPDGTTWTPDGIQGSTYNLIDAEEDVVLDPFSISVANFVDAGEDEVLPLGSVTTVNEVDANTDAV